MRPRHYPQSDILIDTFESPIGRLYLIFSGETLTGILFDKPEGSLPMKASKRSALFKVQLNAYFKGQLTAFDQKIGFSEGTDFEREVWLNLREVPFGETRSYRWLAERINRPKAVRAVGQALSKNPLPIILPCHRIIESDGSLGGYSGGVDIKRRLLDLEYYARQSLRDNVP
ncbi:MAG TPA: methylated-DNA--[protein]-cysteine S-methyltransferase [Thermodesulfovibrionales bacterium]|nr:methylated-DNA--[protein]-cysteine S-methyltransferase [Thermodesulfovibrionales bacterium]